MFIDTRPRRTEAAGTRERPPREGRQRALSSSYAESDGAYRMGDPIFGCLILRNQRVLRLPPINAIDAAAAETNDTELSNAPAKHVDTVDGPLGTPRAPHGPPPGLNQHQSAQNATPLLVLWLPPKHLHQHRCRGNKCHRAAPCPCRASGCRVWATRPQ